MTAAIRDGCYGNEVISASHVRERELNLQFLGKSTQKQFQLVNTTYAIPRSTDRSHNLYFGQTTYEFMGLHHGF